MFCRSCGAEIEPGDKFCEICGKPVRNAADKTVAKTTGETATETIVETTDEVVADEGGAEAAEALDETVADGTVEVVDKAVDDEAVEALDETVADGTAEAADEAVAAEPVGAVADEAVETDSPTTPPKKTPATLIVVLALAFLLLLSSGVFLVLADPFEWFGAGSATGRVGQVAARVNGTDILEADVTTAIERFRIDQSTGEFLDDVAWAQMLQSSGYTPQSLREMVIREQFAAYILILQHAEQHGFTPDATVVEQNLADAKASILAEGDTWEDYLAETGYSSEAAFRQILEAQSVAQALLDAELGDVTPTQEQIETYVSENAAQYAGKRLSLIYLPITEVDTLELVKPRAEEALAKLRSGNSFAEVAKEYSQDTYSAEAGGDIGWGAEAYLPAKVTPFVDALAVDGFTDLILVEEADVNAIFIIQVTDEFILPEDQGTKPVEYALVPKDVADLLAADFVESTQGEAQNAYFTTLIGSDEVVINPMPKGLSYDVDMTLAALESTDDQ